jgi:DNA-binding response OmpR family regulator
VQLTPIEFRLLHLLVMHQGRVVPHERLIEYGWGYRNEHHSSVLKSHISHLRTKLGLAAGQPGGITSVLGAGYVLTRPT